MSSVSAVPFLAAYTAPPAEKEAAKLVSLVVAAVILASASLSVVPAAYEDKEKEKRKDKEAEEREDREAEKCEEDEAEE